MNAPLDSLYHPFAPWNDPEPVKYSFTATIRVTDDDTGIWRLYDLPVEISYCGELHELTTSDLEYFINEEIRKDFDDYDLISYERD